MGVEASAPDLVTARFRDDGLAHTGQQRTNHHHTASEFCTLLDELVALEIIEVKRVGLEGVGVPIPRNLHADISQELDEVVYIADVRDVVDGHRLTGQQGGTDHLQGLVFGALWTNCTAQRMTSLDDK